MRIGSGTRVGPYEIIAAIGAGGMGEAYRARDTKLNRDLALKIRIVLDWLEQLRPLVPAK